jgi:hypothetical protein
LDKDYIIDKAVLPSGTALIGGFTIIVSNDSKITEAPTAHLINSNGKQIDLQVPCLVIGDQRMEFETNQTLNGCLMLVPYFDQNGQGNPVGGAFWMSEKVWDTNFAKLYMFNETSPYFKQVYSDDTPLGIYQGRVVGPIKIWEVEYPANITADPFYLQSSEYG